MVNTAQPSAGQASAIASGQSEVEPSCCSEKARDLVSQHVNDEVIRAIGNRQGKPGFAPMPGMFTITMPDPLTLPVDAVKPEHFLLRDTVIHVWAPSQVFPGIELRCPACNYTGDDLRGDGSDLRSLKTLDHEDFIYVRRYKHVNCKCANPEAKTGAFHFSSCDKRLLASLPVHIRRKLPALVTEKAAIHQDVVDILQRDVINGKSFKDISDMLRELHAKNFYRKMEDYLSWHAWNANWSDMKTTGQKTLLNSFGIKPRALRDAPFPLLDQPGGYSIGMGPNYLIYIYLEDFERRKDYLARAQCSLGAKYLAGDHTFQIAKNVTAATGQRSYEAVFDMTNEFNQVVALLFTGSKSMDDIKGPLSELYNTWEKLGVSVPEYMWVDDSGQMDSALKTAFPSLEHHDGKQRILEDVTHGMRRYSRTLIDGHELQKDFMGDLSKAFFEVVSEDAKKLEEELREQKKWGTFGSAERHKAERIIRSRARHIVPQPAELHKRVDAVFHKYEGAIGAVSRQPLFTAATWDVHQRQLQLIDEGRFSDPLGVIEMFRNINEGDNKKKPLWLGIRGTSRLEGFHNHLPKALQGNRTSPQLAGALVSDRVSVWNIDAGIRNAGDHNFGTYDHQQLESIRNLCESLKVEDPFGKRLRHVPTVEELKEVPKLFTDSVPQELLNVLQAEEAAKEVAIADAAAADDAAAAMQEFEVEPLSTACAQAPAAPAAAVCAALAMPAAPEVSPLPAQDSLPPFVQGLGVSMLPADRAAPAVSVLRLDTDPGSPPGAAASQEEAAVLSLPLVSLPSLAETLSETQFATQKSISIAPSSPRAAVSPPRSPVRSRRGVALTPVAALIPGQTPRSASAKRKMMPIDASQHVRNEEEAQLLQEVGGSELLSSAIKSSKKRREVAEKYNAAVQKLNMLDPEKAQALTFKGERHVAAYAQQVAQERATAASVYDLQQQQHTHSQFHHQYQQQLYQQQGLIGQQQLMQQLLMGMNMQPLPTIPMPGGPGMPAAVPLPGIASEKGRQARARRQERRGKLPPSTISSQTSTMPAAAPAALPSAAAPTFAATFAPQAMQWGFSAPLTGYATAPGFAAPHFVGSIGPVVAPLPSSAPTTRRGGKGTSKKCGTCHLALKGKKDKLDGSCTCP